MDSSTRVDGTDGLTTAGAFREGLVEVAPILAGMVPFGLVAGATAIEADLGLVGASALSVFVFAGASQLAAIDLLGRDAPILVIVLTVAVINLRMAMYSAALAPVMAREPLRRRLVMAHLLTDQAFALTITRTERHPGRTHRFGYYVGVGLPLFVNWQLLTVLGAVLGAAIPGWLPLEATIPLVFLAILVPAVTDAATLVAAAVSGLVATLAAGLPSNTGLLAGAAAGIAAGTLAALRSADDGARDQGSVA